MSNRANGAKLQELIVAAYWVATDPSPHAYRGKYSATKVVHVSQLSRLLDALAELDDLLPPVYRREISERRDAIARARG